MKHSATAGQGSHSLAPAWRPDTGRSCLVGANAVTSVCRSRFRLSAMSEDSTDTDKVGPGFLPLVNGV